MQDHEDTLPLSGSDFPEGPAQAEDFPAEETAAEVLPAEEEIAAEGDDPGIRFEIFSEEIVPAPAAEPTKSKERKKFPWMGILVTVLIVALLAQSAVMANLLQRGNGITGTAINDKGELIVTYSNGTQENLGNVVGADGSDGKDGLDGAGVSGTATDVTKAVNTALRSSVSIFCKFQGRNIAGRPEEYSSAGSGVIYRLNRGSGDAFIITNYHVVYDSESLSKNGIAKEIDVYLYGSEFAGMEMEATYVGGSMYYDIAILRIEDNALLKNADVAAVTGADSDLLQVGSAAIAVGNAEASGISASYGVISVPSEYITMTASDGVTSVDYRVIRVDAAVNHGNSGGGLFDDNGRLIGIVNAKTVDDGVENIGYALPSNVVTAVADNIIDFCFGKKCESVMRPIMGVTISADDSYAVYEDDGTVRIEQTIVIREVTPGQIGSVFQPDDVLVSLTLNGVTKRITQQHHVIDMMITSRPGDTVEFVVKRNGQEVKLSVTVTEGCLTAY